MPTLSCLLRACALGVLALTTGLPLFASSETETTAHDYEAEIRRDIPEFDQWNTDDQAAVRQLYIEGPTREYDDQLRADFEGFDTMPRVARDVLREVYTELNNLPDPSTLPEPTAEELAEQERLTAERKAKAEARRIKVQEARILDEALTPAQATAFEKVVRMRPEIAAQKNKEFREEERRRAALTVEKAEVLDLPLSREQDNGSLEVLIGFAGSVPLYQGSFNAVSARSISTFDLLPGGSTMLNLTGEGSVVGQWDGGKVLDTHQEFNESGSVASRVTNFDNDLPAIDRHATWVAGMIGAYGIDSSARGMSPKATIHAYDYNGDGLGQTEMPEIRDAAALGLTLSNHSYGINGVGWGRTVTVPSGFIYTLPLVSGGNYTVFGPKIVSRWNGLYDVSQTESVFYGMYLQQAYEVDLAAKDFPYHLTVWASGNEANNAPYTDSFAELSVCVVTYNDDDHFSTSFPPVNGTFSDGYDTISFRNLAKNSLVVGAVNDIFSGYSGPGSVFSALVFGRDFSSRGPTDDGRIKPDLVANGYRLRTPSETGVMDYDQEDPTGAREVTGTSFAAPSVTGSANLVKSLYESEYAIRYPGQFGDINPMLSSTLKAVLIHTADDAGYADGAPDYTYGWGLMNTEKAVELVQNDLAEDFKPHIKEAKLLQDESILFTVKAVGGGEPLKVTICWTDEPGTPATGPYVLNDRTPSLVNNLDLRLIDLRLTTPAEQVLLPWKLNPDMPYSPALQADNDVDNVEQIVVATPTAGDEYEIEIKNDGTLVGGSQWVSIIVSGSEAVAPKPFRAEPPSVSDLNLPESPALAHLC